jgi:hypothetical protein
MLNGNVAKKSRRGKTMKLNIGGILAQFAEITRIPFRILYAPGINQTRKHERRGMDE